MVGRIETNLREELGIASSVSGNELMFMIDPSTGLNEQKIVTLTGLKALLTALSGIMLLDKATLAADGADQSDAATIASTICNVTGADGTKGVKLPTSGDVMLVYNSVASNGLPIYPPSDGTINGGSANAAITIEGKTAVALFRVSGNNFAALNFTANT